jgi:hypothetical protein
MRKNAFVKVNDLLLTLKSNFKSIMQKSLEGFLVLVHQDDLIRAPTSALF